MDIDDTLDTLGSKAVEVKDSLLNQGENVKGTDFSVQIATLLILQFLPWQGVS